jgi:hypothetical protein
MDLRHSYLYRLLAHICNILPSRKISGNDLALPIGVHKINPSRNRFGGLLVKPTLKRLNNHPTRTNQHESNHITHPNPRLLRHRMVQREGGNPAPHLRS